EDGKGCHRPAQAAGKPQIHRQCRPGGDRGDPRQAGGAGRGSGPTGCGAGATGGAIGAVILCCGEALIDMLPAGDGFRPSPGGAVYNTALALGRLGVATGFLWPLSRDPFGAMLRAPLAEAGVDLTLAPDSPRPTPLAFVT